MTHRCCDYVKKCRSRGRNDVVALSTTDPFPYWNDEATAKSMCSSWSDCGALYCTDRYPIELDAQVDPDGDRTGNPYVCWGRSAAG